MKIFSADLLKLGEYLQYQIARRELDEFDPINLKFNTPNSESLINKEKYGTFYQISEVSKYNEKDKYAELLSIQKLLGVFRDGNHSFVYQLDSNDEGVSLKVGTIPRPDLANQDAARTQARIFENSLQNSIHGIEFKKSDSSKQFKTLMEENSYCSIISGIPGEVNQQNIDQVIPRVNDLIKTLEGEKYSLMMIFEPIPLPIIDNIIDRLNQTRSLVASMTKVSLNAGQTVTTTESQTNTYGSSSSYTYGNAVGTNSSQSFNGGPMAGLIGGVLGGTAGFILGGPGGGAAGAQAGAIIGGAIGGGLFGGHTKSQGKTRTENENWAETTMESQSNTLAEAKGKSESITKEYFNKSAEYTEKIAAKMVERLEKGKETGLWNTGVYLMAENEFIGRSAAGILQQNVSGKNSELEPVRNTIIPMIGTDVDQKSVQNFKTSLQYLRNPTVQHSGHVLGPVYESLSTPMTGAEVVRYINFPKYDVKGLKVKTNARFLTEINDHENGIQLGCLMDGAKVYPEKRLSINPDTLVKHTFIAGMTGFGKTNTCLELLRKYSLGNRNKHYLVIEPAKNHYRELAQDSNAFIYSLGNEKPNERLLRFRLNPFNPVRIKIGSRYVVHNIQAHIDLVKSAIISALPMHVAMPSILSEAITRSYYRFGWNLRDSTNRYIDVEHDEDISSYIPTFNNIPDEIEEVVKEKGFDIRLQSDYIGALRARIDGLCNGSKGLMFNSRESIEMHELLNRNTILELSHITDPDEKSMIMGFLFGNLYEYRQLEEEYCVKEKGLKHITLIEEAHHLLTNTMEGQDQEKNSARAKFVEVFTNILAEIRSYGEGIIIVEQIPSKITPDAIKNTATKIIHRIMAGDDREYVGNAMVLDKEQIDALAYLKVGEAVFLNEEYHAPMKVVIDKYTLAKEFDKKSYLQSLAETNNLNDYSVKSIVEGLFTSFDIENEALNLIVHSDKYFQDTVDQIDAMDHLAINNQSQIISFLSKALTTELRPQEIRRFLPSSIRPTSRILSGVEDDFSSDLSGATAWIMLFMDFVANYIVDNHGGNINDAVKLGHNLKRYILILLYSNWDATLVLNLDKLKININSSEVLKKPMFAHYHGCQLCEFQCKYGLIIPRIVNPVELDKRVIKSEPARAERDYWPVINNIIRTSLSGTDNNISIDDSILAEMRDCYISLLSEQNVTIFNQLTLKDVPDAERIA